MYNKELTLIKLLLKKDNYNKYFTYTLKLTLNKETKILTELISKYYNKYEDHDYIAPSELILFYETHYPSSKEFDIYASLIKQAAELEISDSLVADTVRRLLAREFAFETINFLMPISEGKAEPEDIYQLPSRLEEFNKLLKEQDKNESPFLQYTADDLFGFDAKADGLLWPIQRLNEVLGPAPTATLGHIFARVETGKTTFTIHTLTNWAKQLKEKCSEQIVLGVFNEENGKRVFGRAYQSLLEIPQEELEAYRNSGKGQYLTDEYNAAGGSHLQLIHDTAMSIEKLTEIFERYPVRACVIDIADHLRYSGDHKENEERRLNHIYRKLRELSDRYQVDILSCGQAGESAANKKRLFTEHMFHSKTAKPGALDYAIGIGSSGDEGDKEFRWLSICKNKLRATGFIHIPVRIDLAKGRYHDLG